MWRSVRSRGPDLYPRGNLLHDGGFSDDAWTSKQAIKAATDLRNAAEGMLMNEMIDQVAQAMAGKEEWAMVDEQDRNGWREIARAAIEAMREPTLQMIFQGEDAGANSAPIDVWKAMIDEALR